LALALQSVERPPTVTLPPFDPAQQAGTLNGYALHTDVLIATSIALRSRVAARAPIGSASLPAPGAA
jgi:hypothetical protein